MGISPSWYAGERRFSSQAVAETYAVSNDQHWGRVEPKPFSTNIAAAWEVVRKFGPDITLDGTMVKDGESWHARIRGGDAHGYSAPHAICLAALKAVGFNPAPTE